MARVCAAPTTDVLKAVGLEIKTAHEEKALTEAEVSRLREAAHTRSGFLESKSQKPADPENDGREAR